MMRHLPGQLAVAAIAALAAACGSSSGGTGTMSVHLVDGPTPEYSAIQIDVRTVQIHSDADGWITLGSPNKVVNLLALTGGVAETLVDGTSLPAGHYDQMRLVLGPNNTVVLADDSPHSLKVPSGMQSGLKLNVSFDVAPNTTKDVFIDFDAHRSVFLHAAGNSGQYLLRPVVFAFDKVVTGAILGTLTDAAAVPNPLPGVAVTAQVVSNGSPAIVRTVTTDAQGHYVLDLLPIGGTYHVVSQPVVNSASYVAKASGAITLTATDPTPTQDLAFSSAASVGSLSGTITPPLGADESDVVSLLQSFDMGAGSLQPLIVDVAAGSYDGSLETYAFSQLPAGDYQAVVTRQSEDATGTPTFQSGLPVPVTVPGAAATLNLSAP
jgi:Domain of unknown function (DUF4382)/Carboxypeptidase regulatory-like domain